ncbi:hypothetical protein [Clostridium sp. Marseille-Q2269]|uniref:hypothetical protein n=1 Tax=Clostridium sp. Marseille-Q2269 TaxID=2942205 RepID=UPI0020734435|nr:hypothetical protein [Clostridium sp. Marseille-Q2269]
MIKITKINWLSKEALEAEVTVNDGKFELICFSHPFKYDLNDFIKTALYCYDISNVMRVEKCEFKVEKLYESFAYNLTGKLANKEDGIVEIGNIKIEVQNTDLPGDIEEDDYISFNCKRIDIY